MITRYTEAELREIDRLLREHNATQLSVLMSLSKQGIYSRLGTNGLGIGTTRFLYDRRTGTPFAECGISAEELRAAVLSGFDKG